MTEGEEKLVREAMAGNPQSFGTLYDHYQPMIYRFIAVKVGRREDAEDITHQVFLSAWQNIGKYRNLGHPFSSWLYRIARNQVIDHYRSRKNETIMDPEDFENIVAPVADRLQISEKIALEKVFAVMKKLKSDHQDVIMMRFVEDLSVRETSKAMQRSEGAIKVLQHRAMQELQNLLKDVNIEL